MKRTHKETLKAILNVLADGKKHSYGELERKANTNWRTIRDHTNMLVLFEAATMIENKVRITVLGKKFLEKL